MQDIPSRAEVIINVTLTDDPAEDNFENVTITALADLKAVVCPVVRAPPTPAEEAAKDAAAKRAAAVRRMAAARRPLSSTLKHADHEVERLLARQIYNGVDRCVALLPVLSLCSCVCDVLRGAPLVTCVGPMARQTEWNPLWLQLPGAVDGVRCAIHGLGACYGWEHRGDRLVQPSGGCYGRRAHRRDGCSRRSSRRVLQGFGGW